MTKEFKSLNNRIDDIKSNFSFYIEKYPKEINKRNQDLIKSFILLCHAEFENYFESICTRIISKSKAQYDANRKFSQSLLSLALMSDKVFEEKDQSYNTAQSRLDKLYSNYFAIIRNNNGIKEKDLKKLLPPIGVEMEQIDETLLAQLDSFGTKRGQIAHTTQKFIYRFKEEISSINSLMSSLKELDNIFENSQKK